MAARCGHHVRAVQLFHELKQRFPSVSDRLLSSCIKQRWREEDCWCMVERDTSGTWARIHRPAQVKDEVEKLSELVQREVRLEPPHLQELLRQQEEHKARLAAELVKERERVFALSEGVANREKELLNRHSSLEVLRLRKEISQLSEECTYLTSQVDLLSIFGPVPLGEIDENFYDNIYTGQMYKSKHRHSSSRHRNGKREGWCCHLCTFRNHPLLNKCESCGMPRIKSGTPVHTADVNSQPMFNTPSLSRPTDFMSSLANLDFI